MLSRASEPWRRALKAVPGALQLTPLQAALSAFPWETSRSQAACKVSGSGATSTFAEWHRRGLHAHASKAKAEAGSPEWPVKAAARSTLTAPEARPEGPGAPSRAPCCGQLPDAVVSERVPASREEELGAWPDSPRLCRPRALLLLPGKQVESEHSVPPRPRPQSRLGRLLPSGV